MDQTFVDQVAAVLPKLCPSCDENPSLATLTCANPECEDLVCEDCARMVNGRAVCRRVACRDWAREKSSIPFRSLQKERQKEGAAMAASANAYWSRRCFLCGEIRDDHAPETIKCPDGSGNTFTDPPKAAA